MASSTSAADVGRYIIRARDSRQLVELIRRIEADPDIDLVDTIGPPDAPHTCVVRMAQEKAAALELQFRMSSQFTIEPDRPLSLFGEP